MFSLFLLPSSRDFKKSNNFTPGDCCRAAAPMKRLLWHNHMIWCKMCKTDSWRGRWNLLAYLAEIPLRFQGTFSPVKVMILWTPSHKFLRNCDWGSGGGGFITEPAQNEKSKSSTSQISRHCCTAVCRKFCVRRSYTCQNMGFFCLFLWSLFPPPLVFQTDVFGRPNPPPDMTPIYDSRWGGGICDPEGPEGGGP